MGQAKQRGTFTQRKERAIASHEALRANLTNWWHSLTPGQQARFRKGRSAAIRSLKRSAARIGLVFPGE